MLDQRIVITGVGAVSSLGASMDAILASMDQSRFGMTETEVGGRRVPYAPVTGYEATDYVERKKVRRMDAVNTYAIGAASMALKNAGIDAESDPALRQNVGVIVGTGYSGFASLVEHQRAYLRDGLEKLSPIHFPNTVYNASAGMVAIELGLNGPNSTVTGLDVSGEFALVYAWMLLRQGMCERVVVIGADDLCPALLEGLHDLGFAARNCDSLPEPFTPSRQGFVPSEGAGAIVLETAAAAARRDATILGEIEGIGIYASADTLYAYGTDSEAIRCSVDAALQQAGVKLDQVDWISSAANGTQGMDAAEAKAWTELLDQAQHSIMPFKRYFGEFSASGVLRLVVGLACTARGKLPGTGAMASLASYARSESAVGKRFIHQGFGLGGNSVSLVISGAPHAN